MQTRRSASCSFRWNASNALHLLVYKTQSVSECVPTQSVGTRKKLSEAVFCKINSQRPFRIISLLFLSGYAIANPTYVAMPNCKFGTPLLTLIDWLHDVHIPKQIRRIDAGRIVYVCKRGLGESGSVAVGIVVKIAGEAVV